ncbi:MAG: hypothetical protein COA88_11865 [Kordia sp.]|nr:MAG: hypothetical protein COA88_11865 [Kordia sp.]
MNTTFKRILILCFFSIAIGQSQNKDLSLKKNIDSLKTVLKNQKINELNKIKTLIKLGESYFEVNDFHNSEVNYNKAENIALNTQDTLQLAIINKKRADLFITNNDHIKALEGYKNSINFFNNTPNPDKYNEELFFCYIGISDVYINTTRSGKALEYVYKSEKYIPKENDCLSKQFNIYILNNLAFIHAETDNYIEAIKYLKKALLLEDEINDYRGKANTYNAFAIIYAKQGENNKAIEYYNYSKKIYEELKIKRGIASILNNLGVSYYDLKNYPKAEKKLQKAINIANTGNYKDILAESHLYLGKVYISLNKIDLGLHNIDKSLLIAEAINASEVIIQCYLEKVQLAKRTNNSSEIIRLLNLSLENSNNADIPYLTKDIYNELYTFHKTNDSKKALFYHEKYTSLNNRIYSIKKINQTEALKTEFTYLKLQSDIKNKDIALALASEKEKASKVQFILIISLGLVLISSLIIIILRQKKLNRTRKKMWASKKDLMALKQENTEKEIEFKNKQITDFAIHISEKNDLLEHIKQKIKKLPVLNKTIDSQIHDVIIFINDDISQNKEKVQLYTEINETTNSFNHKLTNLYPYLSEKERRIATLVRLNHTSKQISLQLNITPASVDNYRSILRKKMDVQKGTSIVKFIKNI